MITELFCSRILNINRGSFHTRSSRHVHLSVFRCREIKNGFACLKSFRAFQETGPSSVSSSLTKRLVIHSKWFASRGICNSFSGISCMRIALKRTVVRDLFYQHNNIILFLQYKSKSKIVCGSLKRIAYLDIPCNSTA